LKNYFLFILFLFSSCTKTLVDYSITSHTVKEGESLHYIAWIYRVKHEDLILLNDIDNPNFIYPGQKLLIRGSRNVAVSENYIQDTTLFDNEIIETHTWILPANGLVIRKFNEDLLLGSGIAIRGSVGDNIYATLPGEVVYSGSGLTSYGNLIIIKHGDAFLTAYGFNKDLLVSEGDEVIAGQIISHMGEGPGNLPQLHFEIRENGTPINPMLFIDFY
tara:strand:+ start:9323 stop:9976 length:654 start_codon:yes stop_codon:yes gene_type:complete